MTIDVQWMIENLATKDDIGRVEASLRATRDIADALREKLDQDIARRLTEAEHRVAAVEQFQQTQMEERRDHIRRADDRRRQWVTWAIALSAPVLVILTWGWGVIVAALKALHLIGGGQ